MVKFEEFSMPVVPTKDQQAARMREAFPQSADSIDFMRGLFGADVAVLAVTENGRSHTTKSYKADSEYPMWLSGSRFLELSKKSQQAEDYVNGNKKNDKRK